ncbi:ComEA family DNA-binding protein, partial [Paractinoplanes brasiliensis]|uniref:Competence protein ComEA n=1 Tax=Paractinoplanes brasiliensis TaxID=52695 RepID=A0A4R6JRU4_9ACTN
MDRPSLAGSGNAVSPPPVVVALKGGTGAYRVVEEGDLRSSHLGDVLPEAEPHVPDRRGSLPPPAWVMPEPPSDNYVFEPGRDRFALTSSNLPEPEEPELTAAGAFGSGSGDGGRRFGMGAFDPGRRGVRALGAVAAVVIVIAAVLAWRARPRVDPVAPPPLNVAESDAEVASAPASGAAEVVVAVGGKVRKPGLVRLAPGARVADALTAAGGADQGVDVSALNLARKVVDGELIMVGVTPPPGVALPTGPAAPAGGGSAGGLVNLNAATLSDLDGLPGVGPVLAQRILDARDAQGGFKAVTDLRKVDGIGDARYEQLKDLVTV